MIDKSETEAMDEMEERTIMITVGDTVFTASLADNTSAEVLKELLAEELEVDSKLVSVSVQDIPMEAWVDSMNQFSDDIMFVKPCV